MAAVTHRKWWWGNTTECARSTVYVKSLADAQSFMAWAERGGPVDAVGVTIKVHDLDHYVDGHMFMAWMESGAPPLDDAEFLAMHPRCRTYSEAYGDMVAPLLSRFGATFQNLTRLDVSSTFFSYVTDASWMDAMTSLRVLTLTVNSLWEFGGMDRLTCLEELTLEGVYPDDVEGEHHRALQISVDNHHEYNYPDDGDYVLALPPCIRTLSLIDAFLTKPVAFAELRELPHTPNTEALPHTTYTTHAEH